MNILFVVHDFLPKHVAGTELYTYNIARTLQYSGHEVSIYTREFGHFEHELEEEDSHYNGVKVKTVYFNSINKEKFRFLSKFRLNFYVHFLDQNFNHSLSELISKFHHDYYNPVLETHFDNHLEEIKPDIIHVQHLKGLSASFIKVAIKRNIPIVLTLHDYWFMCNTNQLLTTSFKRCNGPVHGLKCPTCLIPTLNANVVRGLYPLYAFLFFIRTIYLKRLLKKVNLIISPSNFLRKKFIEHGIPNEKIIFSDNGLNTDLLKAHKQKFNNKLRFAFIGSVMQHKGIHLLIDAFNNLKNGSAELLVYGHRDYAPIYYKQLQQMAANSAIKFMGSFDNDQVYDILAEIDVLVVPSIWYENSPITMHEAVLAGVPILASNIGGMAELVERMQSGLLFQVEDVNDLTKKIQQLIDNPPLVKKLKGKAKEVKTIEQNARELEGIYSRLTKGQ